MSASTVDQQLTNYAHGQAQDLSSALAEVLAPTVPVGSATGKYKKFDDKNAFQVYETERAVGGPAKRIEFEASDPGYDCRPHALELPIDDHERDEAGEGDPLGLERAKIDTLITSATISHEDDVLTKVKAGVTAVESKGVWSSAGNDPVEELDEQIEAIGIETGMMPNKIVFGLGAWRVFRNHAKVIARQPGASLIGVTESQAAKMLLNPSIDIHVGMLSKDTVKFGKDKAAKNIVGAEVMVFYNSPSPSQYDPSFAKTFRTRRGGVQSARVYREEKSRSDILAVDWTKDVQVVSTALCRRLSLS